MSLSDAAVPVFTFTILLSFLYLYSPIESMETDSRQGLPALRGLSEIEKNKQFYSQQDCLEGCTGEDYHCACDFSCYMCVKEGFDKANFTDCNIPNEVPTCV
ncbi:unnamed protein product [Macrosiphum euphorbiae]|uniref:Uncharacterized protein n=1 Tax=Macrosiphum euphorbiae TaxID=13131 RepID=A0AAV0XHK0_9HEMI|nr:unnamed protein product [Macrosiphum euphorbiae]